jgi:FkbH-like protein
MMNSSKALRVDQQVDAWLAIGDRAELAVKVQDSTALLTLPQAQSIAQHLRGLAEPGQELRIAFLRTYTTETLDPWLEFEGELQGFKIFAHHAAFGTVRQEAHAGSGLAQHRPDVTAVMLQREDLAPALASPLAALSAADQEVLAHDVHASMIDLLSVVRSAVSGQVVVTVLPNSQPAALGLFDVMSERSEHAWWARLKARLASTLRERMPGVSLLDLDDVAAQVGRQAFFDQRFWCTARAPFGLQAAREVARRIVAIGTLMKQPKLKLIVLDADNTLWGGIVGEDGVHGIDLGPDYPGNAYVAFQRRLLDLQQRGFVLALCSKNNEADVLQVLREHPHQLLREEHFVARRVNWVPKPENIRALAEELNLGLDSFVFVDDSEHECLSVSRALPQVRVVQVPSHPLAVPGCLDRLARLEVLSVTAEDQAKTQMYAQERERRTLESQLAGPGGDLQSYLSSLDMRMQVTLNDASQVPRISQLTQKTNQFNLTTRRYTEGQVAELIRSPQYLVACFTLADRFGNSGVVGLAIFEREAPDTARLDTLLMSCRVIGRSAESAFLECLLGELAASGVARVRAEYLPTAKNVLAKDFLPTHGFRPGIGPNEWLRALSDAQPRPSSDFPIALEIRSA